MSKPAGCHVRQDWNIGEVTDACPILYLEEYEILFKLWSDYNNHGIYPQDGGYLKQSTKLLQIFTIIGSIYQDYLNTKKENG